MPGAWPMAFRVVPDVSGLFRQLFDQVAEFGKD